MRNRPSSSRTSPHVLTPLKILTQIITLQAAYYTLASALILFTALASGKAFSMDLILSWQSLRGDTAIGWTLSLCWIVVAGIGWVFFFFFFFFFFFSFFYFFIPSSNPSHNFSFLHIVFFARKKKRRRRRRRRRKLRRMFFFSPKGQAEKRKKKKKKKKNSMANI